MDTNELIADGSTIVMLRFPPTADKEAHAAPYNEWGYYGSVPVPADPTRTVYLSQYELSYLHLHHAQQLRLSAAAAALARRLHRAMLAHAPSRRRWKVYERLRLNGWAVRSGVQYGADFVVYEDGPGTAHAPCVVWVWSRVAWMVVSGLVRAAVGARKHFVCAWLDDTDTVHFAKISRWVAEKERTS